MKQSINYIDHHKKVNLKMIELDLNATHIALYNALFLIWNECGFDTELSINRNDVMKISKIGSANTYTKCLKDLDKHKLIKYKPSHNPLIGSKINLYRFDNTSDNSTDNSSVKSSSKGSDNSVATLSKLLNKETIKLLNNNVGIVNENLSKWVTDAKEEKPKKPKKVFSVEVNDCYYACLDYFDESLHPEKEKTKRNWLDTIDKLNRIDGLQFQDIIHLVQRTRSDDFWSKNFLSIPKLRKKDKNDLPYWKVFYNKFKNSGNGTNSKTQQQRAAKANWGNV